MGKIEKIINYSLLFFVPVLLFFLAPIWGTIFEEKKAIEYIILGEKQVASQSVMQNYFPGLKLSHEDKEINGAFVTTLLVYSAGKSVIRTSDFESSIRFEVDAEKRIIDTKVTSTHPADLPVELDINGSQLEVAPLLLNPGDYFYIDILSEKKIKIEKAMVRIAGMEKIKQHEVKAYKGLAINIVEPSENINGSTQKHLVYINSYFLIIFSVIAYFCSCIFVFSLLAEPDFRLKVAFFFLFISMYIVAVVCSGLIPESLFGSPVEKWTRYIAMCGVLLAGSGLAFFMKRKVGVIRL